MRIKIALNFVGAIIYSLATTAHQSPFHHNPDDNRLPTMRFFSRRKDVVVSNDVPEVSTFDRYGDNTDEQSQAKVSISHKRNNTNDSAGKKKGKDPKKKKKKKSKKDKEKRKSPTSSSKLVDRVPTVESYDSANTPDVHEKSHGDVHVSIASDDGDDRYSVAGHLSRGGRSSAGVSVLSDDSDEYGARWRSWDDDDEIENRDANDEMAEKEKKATKKKKKKKHRNKSKDNSGKKKKKSKEKKSKKSYADARDQPDDDKNNARADVQHETTAKLGDSLIHLLGATTTDGEEQSLIEEVEIEHLFTIPAAVEESKTCDQTPVESRKEEEESSDKKKHLQYTKSIIPDDTLEVDNEDGVVTTLMASRTTNKKELLELDEYSIHDVENHSALGQCLRFYSCTGIARLLEFQPKLLPSAVKKKAIELPTDSANQNFELLLGVKSPVASGPPENILVSGFSEDSLDMLREAPSLDTLKRNPSIVVDLTGKKLCLDDDESLEGTRSRKSAQGPRRRKRTPRNSHKVTLTTIEIPETKTHKISDVEKDKFAKSLSVTNSDNTLPVKNKKAPKRGLWLQRRRLPSDDRSVRSGLSAASSKGSTSLNKKRAAQSFFLRIQRKRAEC